MKIMKIISIGNTPLTNSRYGGTIGIILHLSAIARFASVTYINCSRIPESNPQSLPFEVLDVPTTISWYVIQKGFSGLLRPFTIIPSVPMLNEIQMFFSRSTREKVRAIAKKYGEESGKVVIIFESPMGKTLLETLEDFPSILRAHNFEAEYFISHTKPTYFFNRPFYDYLEGIFARKCNLIFSITKEDMEDMAMYYGLEKNKFVHIPASIDTKRIRPFSEEEKRNARERLRIKGDHVGVFIGGGTARDRVCVVPTLDKLADEFENVEFLIAGKISKFFMPKKNLRLMGYVDDETKRLCLAAADFALNPTAFGTGMNIKMLEYLGYGLPLITTPEGARGFPLVHGVNAFVCRTDNFKEIIKDISSDRIDYEKVGQSGRKLIEEEYDMDIIGKRGVEAIRRLL